MPNVTYYLGAGASIESLPLYTSFQERLKVFRDYVYHFSLRYHGQLHIGIFEHYILMLDELIELLDPNDYSSVDVLAHELFISERANQKLKFFQMKYLLSDFFVFEQLDKRKYQYLTQIKDGSESSGFEPYSAYICS